MGVTQRALVSGGKGVPKLSRMLADLEEIRFARMLAFTGGGIAKSRRWNLRWAPPTCSARNEIRPGNEIFYAKRRQTSLSARSSFIRAGIRRMAVISSSAALYR